MKPVGYDFRYGIGADGRFGITLIAEEICEADIFGLQEVERFWK
jgi:endonuclease/exonuclease/phosphatase family metal-dependent hydrolase